ncbi:MAG: Inner membrane protein YhaI [Pseudomonas citronellolis]|nr:MAG: Inner membrane protein YhaI [Pseudomonas citronellolis]
MYTLVNVVISLVLQIVLGLISPKLIIISLVYSLAVLLPSLGVAARRLHDQGKSGWMMLLGFVPLANFYLLYLFCLDSQPGANAYGPDPKA